MNSQHAERCQATAITRSQVEPYRTSVSLILEDGIVMGELRPGFLLKYRPQNVASKGE